MPKTANTKYPKFIRVDVTEEQHETYKSLPNKIGIVGTEYIRNYLDKTKANLESGITPEIDTPVSSVSDDINKALTEGSIYRLKRIRANIKQIVDKVFTISKNNSKLEEIVEKGDKIRLIINKRIDFLEKEQISIEIEQEWIKILDDLGNKVNKTAKITNSKLILENSDLSYSDRAKLKERIDYFTNTIQSLN